MYQFNAIICVKIAQFSKKAILTQIFTLRKPSGFAVYENNAGSDRKKTCHSFIRRPIAKPLLTDY
jgi:hypothetical protein